MEKCKKNKSWEFRDEKNKIGNDENILKIIKQIKRNWEKVNKNENTRTKSKRVI